MRKMGRIYLPLGQACPQLVGKRSLAHMHPHADHHRAHHYLVPRRLLNDEGQAALLAHPRLPRLPSSLTAAHSRRRAVGGVGAGVWPLCDLVWGVDAGRVEEDLHAAATTATDTTTTTTTTITATTTTTTTTVIKVTTVTTATAATATTTCTFGLELCQLKLIATTWLHTGYGLLTTVQGGHQRHHIGTSHLTIQHHRAYVVATDPRRREGACTFVLELFA